MRLACALALSSAIAASTGCNFAVKHPAVTAGIVVGGLGLSTCSLTTSIGEGDTSFTESGRAKCYGITAVAAVGIGLLTAFAEWIGYEDDDAPAKPNTPGTIGDPTNLEPAPVFVPKPLPKPPEPKPPVDEPKPPEPAPEPAPVPPVDPPPTP